MRLPTSVCFPLEVREAESEVERGGCPLAPPIPIPPTPRRTPRGSRARWREARTTNNGLAATPLTRPSPESFSLGVGVSVYLRASPSSSSHWPHSLSSPSPPESVSQEPYLHSEGSPSLPPHASKRGKKNSFLGPLPPLCVGVCLLKSGEEWRRRRLLQLQCAEEAGKEAGSLE